MHCRLQNRIKMLRLLLVFFLCTLFFKLHGQSYYRIEGKVVDENEEKVPYCSIYIPALGKSNMANVAGEFSLSLPQGQYEIIFQSIGFQKRTLQRNIDQNLKAFTVQLQSMAVQIKEVTVDPSSEDPAYNIIRKSIAMAPLYKKQIEAYRCSIYVRSFYNTDDIPWFVEKLADDEDIEDMKAGDINETITLYSFQRPNKTVEKVLGEKSGTRDTLKSGSSYINLNFYDLGGPEIINPLSQYALSVYRFEFQYSFFEEEKKVHKIKIIPRRKGSDLMRGTIYINDGLWNLNKVDVEFDLPLSKVKYKQIYNEVTSNVWMPTNHNFRVDLGAVGFKMHLEYLATLNNLTVETNTKVQSKIIDQLKLAVKEDSLTAVQMEYPARVEKKLVVIDDKIDALLDKDKLSNREAVKLVQLYKKQERLERDEEKEDSLNSMEVTSNRKVEYAKNAFELSDSLWNANREIPLSKEELDIYSARDSINKRDDGDTVYNAKKSTLGKLLFFRGQLQSENKKVFYRPKGILAEIQPTFNTVDGFHLRKTLFTMTAYNEAAQSFDVKLDGVYAFSRERLMGDLSFVYAYSPENRGELSFLTGRRSQEYNRVNGFVPELFNSISTLLFTDNYFKLYQEDYFQLIHQHDILNGLVLKSQLLYSDRRRLKNNSSFALIGDSKDYSTNTPTNDAVLRNNALLDNNTSFVFGSSIEYTIKQYYRMWGKEKKLIPSSAPMFKLRYQQGIHGVINSQSQFKALHFSIQQKRSYRLLDEISYKIGVGKFLERKNVFFADYYGFEVEPFYLMQSASTYTFKQLDYYQGNTATNYMEAHFSIKNDHLLFKYLPFLNSTNLKEKIELRTLLQPEHAPYYEVGYSLDRIFLLFNAGVYSGFNGNAHQSTGIRISMNIE